MKLYLLPKVLMEGKTVEELAFPRILKSGKQQEVSSSYKQNIRSIVRDIFVFSCYSGLAYVDVANLTKNNIRLGIDGDLWIITKRTKTKSQSNIPLLPKAHELIKKYSRYPNKKTEDHIFSIFTNQRMNAYLKEIADLASVDKNLTFHMAGHRKLLFPAENKRIATMFFLAGNDLETSKFLGFSSFCTKYKERLLTM